MRQIFVSFAFFNGAVEGLCPTIERATADEPGHLTKKLVRPLRGAWRWLTKATSGPIVTRTVHYCSRRYERYLLDQIYKVIKIVFSMIDPGYLALFAGPFHIPLALLTFQNIF